MSNFLQNAQESFGNKAEELDDSNGEGAVKPREFFWDNIVLFVVSSIIGLAAIDVITEFLRGGDVACFSPLGVELSEAQAAYINSHCAGFLPPGAYIPAFMVIHAILITIPHYLWLNHYGGNFDFFFQLASSLKRLREGGEHVSENMVIVTQLETTFSTFGRNTIFTFYKLKLVVQFLWSLAGILFVIVFFFQDFTSNFRCPTDFDNSTEYLFWPLETDVVCVFEALELLHTLWWAEIGLLALVCFGLFWALIWCYATHSSELGARGVALFSFQSGLAPIFYVPPLPVPSCCRAGRQWLLRFFTSVPWLSRSGPKIQTDLDFLLMKLYRTDNGLGHVFREVQIEKEIKLLADDDQRRLALHGSKQRDFIADNANERRKKLRDREQDEEDLKWKFLKETEKDGVYGDFKTLPSSHKLLLTDTMRGAVLAFGQRAPHNKNAISISFGDIGYASTLARVFSRVALLNFSPDYSSADEVVRVTQYRTSTVSLVFPENVLSSQTGDVNQFVEKLRTIWVPPGTNPRFKETSFIVVGPIPRDKDYNVTNLDLLFEQIYGSLGRGAVLLTIYPMEIAGKRVEEDFLSYEPNKPHFLPLRQEQPVFPMNRNQATEWPARESVLDASTEAKTTPPASVATPTSGDIAVQVIQSQTDSETTGLVSAPPLSTGTELPFEFPVRVRCGKTKVVVKFSTYYYTNNPPIARHRLFDPPSKKAPAAKATTTKSVPSLEGKSDEKKSDLVKEKNVNCK